MTKITDLRDFPIGRPTPIVANQWKQIPIWDELTGEQRCVHGVPLGEHALGLHTIAIDGKCQCNPVQEDTGLRGPILWSHSYLRRWS